MGAVRLVLFRLFQCNDVGLERQALSVLHRILYKIAARVAVHPSEDAVHGGGTLRRTMLLRLAIATRTRTIIDFWIEVATHSTSTRWRGRNRADPTTPPTWRRRLPWLALVLGPGLLLVLALSASLSARLSPHFAFLLYSSLLLLYTAHKIYHDDRLCVLYPRALQRRERDAERLLYLHRAYLDALPRLA